MQNNNTTTKTETTLPNYCLYTITPCLLVKAEDIFDDEEYADEYLGIKVNGEYVFTKDDISGKVTLDNPSTASRLDAELEILKRKKKAFHSFRPKNENYHHEASKQTLLEIVIYVDPDDCGPEPDADDCTRVAGYLTTCGDIITTHNEEDCYQPWSADGDFDALLQQEFRKYKKSAIE